MEKTVKNEPDPLTPLVELIAGKVEARLKPRLMPESPLSVKEASKIMSVGSRTLYALIEDGKVKALPNSPVTLIPHSEVVRWNEGRVA